MNISPTPRRYNSRGHEFGRSDDDAAFHPFNKIPPIAAADRIVPEEYRVNSQMINKLIKQNKQLTSQLEQKQEDIDRLNVLVGSLRGKLIKYTELNKKLNQSPDSARFASEEVLQIGKTRASERNTDKIGSTALEDRVSDIYTKLDALTRLVGGERAPEESKSSWVPPVRSSMPRGASEDDILTQESSELKQLEDQIDLLKRKLLIKRENELRKLSLNKELLDLMEKLDVSAPTPAPTGQTTASLHCDQCHNTAAPTAIHGPAPAASARHVPPYMSMAQALETPSPAARNSKTNDTLW